MRACERASASAPQRACAVLRASVRVREAARARLSACVRACARVGEKHTCPSRTPSAPNRTHDLLRARKQIVRDRGVSQYGTSTQKA
eukprot:507494-Pleurochrysis_carterae.AAC.1